MPTRTRSRRSQRERDYIAIARHYAEDVVDGEIPASKWIVLACKRHLADVEKAGSKSFAYRLDEQAATKACRFIELLPHTKGQWVRTNERLILSPWQIFKTVSIFGWLRKKDGLRRFRKALLLIPRKNGKSAWAAAVGLYMLAADGEPGAEVYSGATTEKQAWEVFKPARQMALKTPQLRSAFGLEVNASNLNVLADASRFEPVIGKPGDGSSPSCAIIDEYHEHDTDDLVSTMETGMGAREQPLLLMITTAGDNIAGPCYAAMQTAQRVLEGVLEDEELFALIYGCDAEDDWTSEAALRKANPNFDVSVRGDFLLAQQRAALNDPRKAGAFKTKHLNVWVQSRDAYYNTLRWIEAGDPTIRLADFKGQPARLGVDLASTVDIAALEILIRLSECRNCAAADRLIAQGRKYVRFGRYYVPYETAQEPENEHYRGWIAESRMTATDGDMIDYAYIEDDILDLAKEVRITELAYDPHQATYLVTRLMTAGVSCIEVRPTVLNFSQPLKEDAAMVQARQVAHDGDPVMAWMVSNVVAKLDAKDNVYPRKDRAENKIDGVVARLSALARFMAADGVTAPAFQMLFV